MMPFGALYAPGGDVDYSVSVLRPFRWIRRFERLVA